MMEFLHLLLHTAWHSLLDAARLIPFLFLTYLLMEFLEHREGERTERYLRNAGKVGPLVGGALGILPQCGFSAAASSLYAGRVITSGTLIAIYLSTSDEMLPILISSAAPLSFILKILATKLIVGMVCGFAVDLIARKRGKQSADASQIDAMCERDGCACEGGILRSAIKHTLQIGLFVLLFTFLMNLAVELIGEDKLGAVLSGRPVIGNLLAALLGLVPSARPPSF